ncbi:stalk domain-containing protein [Alkalihalophilus marmarensis]|uniref:Copper amine oxidase-like N-terminal domain-containing protein n=1 Tax=Alkalihalophilus marmarensis DSM 21297 TaxID=1188261 RepID=U6SKZ2_9BACI|nr:stalk domain-containing protein [Alkalihalophilus marmarensis]ERN52052.1 hypothetical protein A33I_18335 [Alkalihalophilus marmarensis DSM 21297]
MKKGLGMLVAAAVLAGHLAFPASGAANAGNQFTFELNSTVIFNEQNQRLTSPVPNMVHNGVTYISVRAISNHLGYSITYVPQTREYVLTRGEHQFRFLANSRTYQYNNQTFEHRNNGQTRLQNQSLMIPIRTLAEHTRGTLTVQSNRLIRLTFPSQTVTPPAAPIVIKPQAVIHTEKEVYRIGEPISYGDRSLNRGVEIIKRTWENNEPVFFEPGTYTISLEVENRQGQTDRSEKTITVTNDVFQTKEQYMLTQGPIGGKMPIDRAAVLSYKEVPYTIAEHDYTYVRANSPEQITREGFFYKDELEGPVRFMIHKQNAKDKPVNLYLVARNNQRQPAQVKVNHFGMAGPHIYVEQTGKSAVTNYLRDVSDPKHKAVLDIPAGQMQIVAPILNSRAVPKGQTITAYVDTESNIPVEYEVIVLDQDHDLMQHYTYLKRVDAARDGIHIRGTFEKGNRTLHVSEPVGYERNRMVLTDGVKDHYIQGIDAMTNSVERNLGNFGVSYEVKLDKVAPHTAIIVNPRGGHYGGAFLVNGNVVQASNNSILSGPTEAGILHRTGAREESVTITFTPAAGSNMPINFLFIPMQ